MACTKTKLIEIAKDMDIKGIANLTKQQLIDYIIDNPCVKITAEECENMTREQLRSIARKCNVLLGKKTHTSICSEITTKFKGKGKTLADLDCDTTTTNSTKKTNTKDDLIKIANDMGIKGFSSMTKQELIDYIVDNPCVNTTVQECEQMTREQLRSIARKCNILLGKKTHTNICSELIDKFQGKRKTLADLGEITLTIKNKKPKNKMAESTPWKEIFEKTNSIPSLNKSLKISKSGHISFEPDDVPKSKKSKSLPKSIASSSTPKSKKSPKLKSTTSSPPIKSKPKFTTPSSVESKKSKSKPKFTISSSVESKKSKPKFTTPSSSIKSESPTFTTPSSIKSITSFKPIPESIKHSSLPKVSKSQAQPFPQIYPELSIETDVSPKQVVKKIIEAELGEERDTNFTKAIKINQPGANTYTTKTCNINVESLKPLSGNSGISGAGIFLGMMKAINKQSPNVVLKMWKYTDGQRLDDQLECLSVEWDIYTYIIPFMFFCNLSPCVLYPIETGQCTRDEMVEKLPAAKMKSQQIAKFTITPYIQYSLVDIFNSKQYAHMLDIRNIVFQTVYTIAAFNKMGMRHNDCHTNNIRIVPCPNKPFKICFKLQAAQVYALVPFLVIFNDFDRTSIGTPMSDITKIKNPCTAPGGYYCNYIHQCDVPVSGARDLLIAIFYIYDGMDPDLKYYVYHKIFAGTHIARERLNRYVSFTKSGNVNWNKTKHGEFLFTRLNDDMLKKAYPTVDSVLNDLAFLNLCFASSTMKPSPGTDSASSYKTYDFYNVDIIKEYPKFKDGFYKK
jgi:hypothetical protein